MYTLTEEVRKRIQSKSYEVIDCLDDGCYLPWTSNRIAIGDRVTHDLLYLGIPVDVVIFDGMTERRETPMVRKDILENFSGQDITVSNPPGIITNELLNAVMKACRDARKGTRTKIKVNGEEDLAILPAILFAQNGTVIFYGIPHVGMAYMIVDQREKDKVMEMLWEMK